MLIEEKILNYLNDHLSVPAYTEKQPTMPREYALLEKGQGSERDCISNATVTVSCYARSMLRAAKINDEIKSLAPGLTSIMNISKCRVTGSYNDTLTDSKQYRYRSTLQVTYMED